MSHAPIIHRIYARQRHSIIAKARICAGPVCCGVLMPNEAFATKDSRNCKACVARLQVIELESMLAQARMQSEKLSAERLRIIARTRDLDEIARRAAGDRRED